jgi:uncharacterized protein YecE (DUF72 family)
MQSEIHPLRPRIGCAGWGISSAAAGAFPAGGSHLERYARVLPAVEINSSFYRPHRPATYARWRDSVPEDFRFAVKMPKAISHEARLRGSEQLLVQFLNEAGCLEEKLGCLLLQLPPRLAFEKAVVADFLGTLRRCTNVPLACEPRHLSWFNAEVAALFDRYRVAYVEADPRVGALPRWQTPLVYLRLHGSPEMYHSAYGGEVLDTLTARLAEYLRAGIQPWCVFDNTASGAALPNALELQERLVKLGQSNSLPF